MSEDEKYMRDALCEAEAAAAEDEIPIGAVVVCRGRIVAKGHNMTERLHDATAHAEMIAITAAILMTLGSNTFERLRTPVFSPYVVLAGAPKSDARAVARPSPRSVLLRPGSSRRSFSMMEERFLWSAMCSAKTTNATGI